MNNKFLTIIGFTFLAFAAVFFAACNNVTTTRTAENSNKVVVINSANTNGNAPISTDAAKAFTVDFKSEPAAINAGTPVVLSFTIKDKQGAIVKDLSIVHEKPMHLLVVSKDLAEFYHIHPEQQEADGSYKVAHVFPNGGGYRLYADFTPQNSAQIVEQFEVKVAGQERAAVPLVPDEKLEKTVDGLRVVMTPGEEIKAGKELMLNFKAFDAASGKPADNLQNYLGALAHFVIISEDMKDFVHAHPMSKGEKMDGMQMDSMKMDESKPHTHETMEGETSKVSDSEVSAHTGFPRAGIYKLWAQFQRGGKVINVPFIVRVPA